MAEPRPWTVNRPGPLLSLAPDLWCVEDEVPGLKGAGRRMTIARLPSGGLIFFNAIPVPEETLTQIRALGRPASLIIPNHFHALDAAAFVQKLGLTAYAPDVGVPLLAERLKCQPIAECPLEPGLSFVQIDGFKTHEAVMLFRDTVIVADLVTNVPHASGLNGLGMRLVGFTGPTPRLPLPVRLRVGRDLPSVKRLLNELASRPDLKRLVPSHGLVVTEQAGAALQAIATAL